MEYKAFLQKLKELPGAVCLYSPEAYLMNRGIEAIKAQYVTDFPEMNVSVFDEKADAEDVVAACLQFPFMSEKRVVIVKGLPDKKGLDRYMRYLQEPAYDAILVLALTEKLDMRTQFAKALKEAKAIMEIDAPDQPMLIKWLMKIAQENGNSITAMEAEFLLYRTGTDMMNLVNEMGKLSAYVGQGQPITRDAIQQMIAPSMQENVFKLLDMMIEKKNDQLLHTLDGLLANGEKPAGIFTLLMNTFHNLFMIKLDGGRNQVKMALPDFVVRKYQKQLRTVPEDLLRQCVARILTNEERFKSGKMQPKDALYDSVFKIMLLLK